MADGKVVRYGKTPLERHALSHGFDTMLVEYKVENGELVMCGHGERGIKVGVWLFDTDDEVMEPYIMLKPNLYSETYSVSDIRENFQTVEGMTDLGLDALKVYITERSKQLGLSQHTGENPCRQSA